MKDYTLEKRKYVIGMAAVVIVLIYVIRLFDLQIMTDDYKKNADSNAFLNKIQYPSRGAIYDRNGKLLVFNQPAYDITFVPREVTQLDTLDLCRALNITFEQFQKRMKEQVELQPIADAYKDYKTQKQTIEESLMLLEEESDEEMREMLKEELSDAKKRVEELEQELKVLLLPKDPNDDKNVIVEFRAGAGGDEAALFTAEICRMYIKYAESRGWKTELTSADENGIGGFKDATLLINGAGAYSRMKYESGTHRVQRVPETESGGRIHTSTMTVAIMPEVDDVEVQIDPKDYKFDVFRASGNGGQCVNTTDSAVRLTHFPSGIVISCQDEKSQLKNKDKALKILRARLYDLEQQKQHDEMAELRKSQVGTGDRSEKIRTYNFPQGRVTDHRIKLTLYKLDAIMNGDLDEIIDSLIAADQAAKLSSMQEEA